MDVLEDDHDGAAPGDGLEQAPEGPRRLVGVRRPGRGADGAHEALHDQLGVVGAGERAGEAFRAAERANDLPERPEADPLAVREAPSRQNGRRSSLDEHCDQAGLADPGRSEDGEQPATSLRLRAPERELQRGELLEAPDEWPVEPPRDSGGVVKFLQVLLVNRAEL